MASGSFLECQQVFLIVDKEKLSILIFMRLTDKMSKPMKIIRPPKYIFIIPIAYVSLCKSLTITFTSWTHKTYQK